MITILFLSANPDQTAQFRHLIPKKKYNNEIIENANPDQTAQEQLKLIEECNKIIKKIRSGDGRKLFKLEQRHDICINDLIEELLNYNPQILHFAGHGSKKSALFFKNEDTRQLEEVSPSALSNLFKVWGKKINLVFLNACYSEKQARAIAEHVNCVIGMSGAIPDNTAIEFASAFYLSLGFNKSVQEAFDDAIVQLGLLSIPGDQIPKLIVKEGIDPSKITAATIGSNIQVEEGINVTAIIQEIKSFGLNFLPPNYFKLYKSSQKDFVNWKKDFVDWKKGFSFKLPNIMDEFHFRRTDIINEIIQKLDDNNGDHALLLLGKSGASKSTLLMDVMCHYFRNGYIVFYNFGEEEIKDVYDIENSLRDRLKDGNKILVAVDNVHDKRTAAIFSVIDSLKSYEEKKDNMRFILTGRQPEFDRFVNDRLDTVSEPVRQSIQKLHKQLIYSIPNFDSKEILDFLERYKDEEDIKKFVNNNNFDYNKLFAEKDEVALNNISSLIYEKTKGDPILVKFFIFGKGFAADVASRFSKYLGSEIKLQSMLVCILLERAEIPISYDLIEGMNLTKITFELTDETLTFIEDENRWKTIHPKWDLELLAYLYNIKDHSLLVLLEKRKNILRKVLELLLTHLESENNRFSIFATLYDSTTTDTEENKKFPITIVDTIVTNKNNLINTYLNENSRYNLYIYYIAKNYVYSFLESKSLNAIDEALKIFPNRIDGLGIKGNVLSDLGKHEEAIKCYDEIINKLDPKNVYAWFNKGIALHSLGRHEEAIKCYDEIINKLDPKNVYAWFNKGNALIALGKYMESKLCYHEITNKLDPKNFFAWFYKGIILGNLGEYEQVIKCYDEITKLDPKYIDDDIITKLDPKDVNWIINKLEHNYVNSIITKLDPKYADKITSKLNVKYDDVSPIKWSTLQVWILKGNAFATLGKYEEAIKCYDEIINKLDPKYIPSWFYKGIAFATLDRYEESIKCCDEIINKLDAKHVLAWLHKGNALDSLGRYEEAIQCYDEITRKLDPNYVNAWLNKGVALANLGKNEEAIQCYDEIITRIDPNFVGAWYNKGNTLRALGRDEEAIQCYDEIIDKLDPNYVNAWLNKGVALANLGKNEEAIQCYDEIINKLDPKNVYAWFNKGNVLSNLDKYNQAIKCYDEALKIEPNNNRVLYNIFLNMCLKLGATFSKLGRYKESIYYYDEIINKLDAKHVLAWLHKGNALDSLGRYEEAIQCYDEALKIEPNNKQALESKYINTYLNKGHFLSKLGRYKESIYYYDEIINKLDAKHVSTLLNKGNALDSLGRYEEAIQCYDEALKIEHINKQILYSKGYTLINLGKYEIAIEYFDLILSADPDHVNALQYKKIAEEKLRNRNK